MSIVVHFDLVAVFGVTVTTAVGDDGELVVDGVAERLFVEEDVGIVVFGGFHGKLIVHVVIGIVDHQRNVGLGVCGFHNGDPNEFGVVFRSVSGRCVGERDVDVSTSVIVIIVVAGVVVVRAIVHGGVGAGVAIAVFDAFTVVPASRAHVRSGERKRREAFAVLIDGQVQVGSGMSLARGTTAVAGVANGANCVRFRDLVAFAHIDLGKMSVPAHNTIHMLDEDVVAVALIVRTSIGSGAEHTSIHDGENVISVHVAGVLGKVQSVGVVAVLEVVVLVSAGVVVFVGAVALGEDVVVTGGEGESEIPRTACAVFGVALEWFTVGTDRTVVHRGLAPEEGEEEEQDEEDHSVRGVAHFDLLLGFACAGLRGTKNQRTRK